jgi:hypothetical protein
MDMQKEAKRILSVKFLNKDFNFHDLENQHFDPSLFPPSAFCPALLPHHPGLDEGDAYATGLTTFQNQIPLPVMAAQATFIREGMVLSVWTHHCVADGAEAKNIVRYGQRILERGWGVWMLWGRTKMLHMLLCSWTK